MLAKPHRLKKKKDIQRVFSQGVHAREGAILVKFCVSKELDSRFGIVVSKKVSRSAVKRNRIRRVISEFLRLNLSGFSQTKDVVVIVLPGKNIAQYNAKEIRESVLSALQKASLLNL